MDHEDNLYNKKGRVSTRDENRLALCLLKYKLEKAIENYGWENVHEISWNSMESEVATMVRMKVDHVVSLRKNILDSGTSEVQVFDGKTRGYAEGTQTKTTKATKDVLVNASNYVETIHRDGKTASARKIQYYLLRQHKLAVHCRTVGRMMKTLGLSWAPLKSKPRTFASHRHENLRNYLIELDKYVRHINNGNQEKYTFVFTDESYIHQNHSSGKSYLTLDQRKNGVNKKTSKGRRLIIMNAITPDNVLAECDETGRPVIHFEWNGDTPHQKLHNGKLTTENLWLATSHTGDYHDNMNSDMFLKWVSERLIPIFKKLYPDNKMILVTDNAPYHHKRRIGSLYLSSKKQVLELMVKVNVEYIDLPINEERLRLSDNDSDVEDRGMHIRVPFDSEEQRERAGVSKPRIANLEELKVAFVTYLKENDCSALNCEVENIMKKEGFIILWTPPHSPDLQPIETFWANGKNWSASHHKEGQTMKETIRRLRQGCYGNGDEFSVGDVEYKKEINYQGLYQTMLANAGQKFVPLCKGISGKIGELIVDPLYTPEPVRIPIDTLVLDLVKQESNDEQLFKDVEGLVVLV